MADTAQKNENIAPLPCRTRGKTAGWIAAGLAAAVVAFLAVLLVMVKTNGYVSLFGRSMFRVVTGSMEPTIMTGALLVAEDCDIGDIRRGDIVCFRSEETGTRGWIITHRVVSVVKNGDGDTVLETKGDANSSVDSQYVTRDNLIGRVTRYTGEGNLLSSGIGFLTSGVGFISLIILPCLFISGMLLSRSVRQIRQDIARLQAEADKTDAAQPMTQEEMDALRRQIEQELLEQRESILAEVKDQLAQQGEQDERQAEQVNRDKAEDSDAASGTEN